MFRFSILIFCLLASSSHADPPPKIFQFFNPAPKSHVTPAAPAKTPATAVPNPAPHPRPLFEGPPLPTVSDADARRVQAFLDRQEAEKLLREVLSSTIETQRQIAAARLNEYLEKMLDKNLSRIEMQFVLGILEAATVEQIRDGSSAGPLAYLAKNIYAKLDARVGGTPEARAVKILAKQVNELVHMSPVEQTRFRDSIGRFRQAFAALGDDKIDGKGMLLLLAASVNGSKNILTMALQRVKDILNPLKLESSLKAIGVLLNTGLNPDPISKDILRDFLDVEMDKQRLVANRDGSVNWRATLEGLAQTAPEDAKNLGNVLVGAQLVQQKDVDTALKIMDSVAEVRSQIQQFDRLMQEDPQGAFMKSPEHFQRVVQELAKNEVISERDAVKMYRAAGMVAAAREADKFARQLQETLNTPAGQWPQAPAPEIVRLPPVWTEELQPMPASTAPALLERPVYEMSGRPGPHYK